MVTIQTHISHADMLRKLNDDLRACLPLLEYKESVDAVEEVLLRTAGLNPLMPIFSLLLFSGMNRFPQVKIGQACMPGMA